MQSDVNFFHLRQFLRLALRADVEADDHCIGSRSQKDVVFRDSAHTAMQDLDLHLFRGKLSQSVGQHFRRALHVSLQDDGQLFHAGRFDLLRQSFQRKLGTLGQNGLAGLLLAIF